MAIFLSQGKTKRFCEEGEADVGGMCMDGKNLEEKQVIMKSPDSELIYFLVLKAIFITFNLLLVKSSDTHQ